MTMKASSVQQNLSLYGFTRKRVEAIGTVLRKFNMLPKAGRGLHAPEVSCEQAAIFALAVAGSERVEDAAKVALTLANLIDETGKVRLVQAISDAICNPSMAGTIKHVRVTVESQMAEITLRDNSVQRFFSIEKWNSHGFVPESQGQAFVGRIGHIGGGVLDQLAADHHFNDKHDAGYANDEGELVSE